MHEADEASGRDKSVLESKAGKVKAKLDDALTKVSAVEVAPLPKVEVSDRTCCACMHARHGHTPACQGATPVLTLSACMQETDILQHASAACPCTHAEDGQWC
jgi:hypothetical protein